MKRKTAPQVAGADDLDDGLDYAFDEEYGFESDDGGVPVSGPADNDSEEDGTINTTEEVDTEDSRKRGNSEGKNVAKVVKRQRLKERMALKKKRRMETEVTVKRSIAAMEPAVIADYIAKKARLWHPQLSSIELDDRYLLPQSRVCDMSFWDKVRSLPNFENFLNSCTKPCGSGNPPEEKGAPFAIVICISAIRACDVRRAIPKAIKSMKIIAKNSISKDCQNLQSFNPAVVLTTPERLKGILEREALKLINLETVIIDSSFLDPKTRSVLDDVPETLAVMKQLVTASEKAKIALF
ncbi:U3-containing 90S pre-ribosomal complex subunit-domain containing protein [Lipomyces chichibuensis]|uniref:U3-containing 90S pre-ribosomal complex subunit-domain containing protein n=1 Tax=Lipomyces chichibuensis TaxID=1546026 RepID=UPI00334430ED